MYDWKYRLAHQCPRACCGLPSLRPFCAVNPFVKGQSEVNLLLGPLWLASPQPYRMAERGICLELVNKFSEQAHQMYPNPAGNQ